MRIDLPMCNFKNCKYSFDSNCTKKSEYERCEYRQQKAKIENLKAENFELKNGYFQKRYEKTEHQELIGLRKAWQKSRMDYIDLNAKWEGKFKTAKAEAIKEFTERLRNKFFNYYDGLTENTSKSNHNGDSLMFYEVTDMIEDCIDNLVEEMTEGEDET